MRDDPKFTAKHEAALRRQKITDAAPGPIVHDMSAFLELIVERRDKRHQEVTVLRDLVPGASPRGHVAQAFSYACRSQPISSIPASRPG